MVRELPCLVLPLIQFEYNVGICQKVMFIVYQFAKVLSEIQNFPPWRLSAHSACYLHMPLAWAVLGLADPTLSRNAEVLLLKNQQLA